MSGLNKKLIAGNFLDFVLLRLPAKIEEGNERPGSWRGRQEVDLKFARLIRRLAVLLVLSALTLYGAYRASEVHLALLPAQTSGLPWQVSANSDRTQGGRSDIVVRDDTERFDFDFTLAEQLEFPYVAFATLFTDPEYLDETVDWSRYSSLIMEVRCKPANTFALVLYTFDDKVTRVGDYSSFRNPTAHFSCDTTTRQIQMDLHRFDVPEWWLLHNGLELSDRSYRLDRVMGFAFLNSLQSPVAVPSNLVVSNLYLSGRNWHYLHAALVGLMILWVSFITLYLRQRSREIVKGVQEKLQQQRPLVACQQVPTQPCLRKDKDAVLHYMATQYTNSDLSLETAAAELGINRTKINSILKEELGFTFSAYLARLRLTEASRLLLEKEASVSEIAYRIGYGNPSYFITVFKKEFGCTPKTFRNQHLMQDKEV